ncbi:MAG: hypothetical protein AAGB00_00770 [Planctomycetota bacterium]
MLALPAYLIYALMLALFALAAPGCGTASSPGAPDSAAIAEYRQSLLLAEEPAGPVTPVDLREQEDGFTGGNIVLVGQIGGVANPWKESEPDFPWKADEATFFLVDPGAAAAYADHAGGDPDHAETCAFCASHADDNLQAIAVVTFNDAAGKPIPLGVADLLGLRRDAVVVVRGEAQMLPSVKAGEPATLAVVADGVYLRE